MAADKLLKYVLSTGDWKRCSFCNRVLPTKAHTETPGFNRTVWLKHDNGECIEDSGRCTYCEKIHARKCAHK